MKPLIKPKSKFKEKIKNFFHFDMDEVTKEEEPTKVFEKIPRNKIFLGIFLFLVIVNVLVGFGIDFLYIRAILGFLFLVTVPGLLIMLCFKIRTVKFWEFLVYTIGLSIAFIMFAGLIVNWTLPVLGITDKPLSLYPILICFDIFLITLGIVGWKRNKDFPPFQFTVPKLDALNNVFFIIPMTFPVLAILGAFLLNNHGSNILTMIMLGGIAVYVLFLTIFRKKLNENIWPWALWMIGLALLLSGWMRSWFVSGVDINVEYHIFKLTKEKALWAISNLSHTYNAMISVTVLPTILSLFTQINDQFILKLFFPIIFMFVPLIVYTLAKKYSNGIICFLASFFFISQSAFLEWWWIPIRQEIAFLFFGLMLLILFTKEINPTLKKVLFLIFGVSMIVSHYSTSYIALAIFTLTYIITIFYKKYENKKIKRGKIRLEQKSNFNLTGILILLLLIFGFLWYSQVTPTSNGLIDFAHKSFSNLGNIFSQDVQAGGATPLDQFNIFFKPIDKKNLLADYVNSTPPHTNLDFTNESLLKYTPHIINSKILPYLVDYDLSSKIYLFFEILKKLIKFFVIIGFFITIFIFRKKIFTDYNYLFLISACFLLFILLIILPFISVDYDLLRTYQQVLILFSLQAIFGSLLLFKFFKKNPKILIITLLFLLYFLSLSGFVFQITGGMEGLIRLNNIGQDYDLHFVHLEEVISANWLFLTYNSPVYLDRYARSKLDISNKKNNLYKLVTNILPSTIDKNSYVYLDYSNVFQKIAFSHYKGNTLSYNFPTEFLKDNTNRIYNNGGSEIFK